MASSPMIPIEQNQARTCPISAELRDSLAQSFLQTSLSSDQAMTFHADGGNGHYSSASSWTDLSPVSLQSTSTGTYASSLVSSDCPRSYAEHQFTEEDWLKLASTNVPNPPTDWETPTQSTFIGSGPSQDPAIFRMDDDPGPMQSASPLQTNPQDAIVFGDDIMEGVMGGPSSSQNDLHRSESSASFEDLWDESLEQDHDHAPPKRRPGRKGPLSEAKRLQAAYMRRHGNCSSCRAQRCRCGPENPCKACIVRHGQTLLNNPCRRPLVDELMQRLLPDCLAWAPHARQLTEVFGQQSYRPEGWDAVDIPIRFIHSAPSMMRRVRIVVPGDPDFFEHEHWIHAWPNSAAMTASPVVHRHVVLPAELESPDDLDKALSDHLTVMVRPEYLHAFPAWNMAFQILPTIFQIYEHYKRENPRFATTMKSGLKLLYLIHTCGDATVDPGDKRVQDVLRLARKYPENPNVTACMIRAQIGASMSRLAPKLLKEVLTGLLTMMLGKECENFLAVNCTLALLLMSIESLQYHAAKIGYHANYCPDKNQYFMDRSASDQAVRKDLEEAVNNILRIYRICFFECHTRLLLSSEPPQQQNLQLAPPQSRGRRRASSNVSNSSAQRAAARRSTAGAHHDDQVLRFAAEIHSLISSSRAYLHDRAAIDLGRSAGTGDPTVFFNRLLAKMYLMEIPNPDAVIMA